jgi:hypothetical protein
LDAIIDEILRSILPEELTEVPSAFTAVGHIGKKYDLYNLHPV